MTGTKQLAVPSKKALMNAFALLALASTPFASSATTFLDCIGDKSSEIKVNEEIQSIGNSHDVKFHIAFENTEGFGKLEATGGVITGVLKSCTFSNDWIECKETATYKSRLGEKSIVGWTYDSTSMFRDETQIKLNRKTGLGDYSQTSDTRTTEPKEKQGTYYTHEKAKFVCKVASKKKF